MSRQSMGGRRTQRSREEPAKGAPSQRDLPVVRSVHARARGAYRDRRAAARARAPPAFGRCCQSPTRTAAGRPVRVRPPSSGELGASRRPELVVQSHALLEGLVSRRRARSRPRPTAGTAATSSPSPPLSGVRSTIALLIHAPGRRARARCRRPPLFMLADAAKFTPGTTTTRSPASHSAGRVDD